MAKKRRGKSEAEPSKYGALFFVSVLPLAGAVFTVIISGYTVYSNVATKPYVEDELKKNQKYVDEKAMQILKEAFDHSDNNRRDMTLRTEQVISELKVRNAIVDTKIETLIDMVKKIKDRAEDGAIIKNRR